MLNGLALELLNPGILVLLPLALIPLIIHILNKPKPRKILFPSLMFLQKISKKQNKISKLKNLLLMAVRILLISLVVMAAAKPIMNQPGPSENSVIIIVDDSFKMGVIDGGISRFDRAKNSAKQVIDTIPSGQKAALLFTSGNSTELVTNTDYLKMVLERENLTYHFATVTTAIKEASVFAKETRPTFYVISDMAATSWKNLEIPKNGKIIAIDIAKEPVENIYFKEVILEQNKITAVLNKDLNDIPCTLAANGIKSSTQNTKNGRILFLVPNEIEWGEISFDKNDALSIDNRFYFSGSHTEKPRVHIDDLNSPILHALITNTFPGMSDPSIKFIAKGLTGDLGTRFEEDVSTVSFIQPAGGKEKKIKWFDINSPLLRPFSEGRNGDIQAVAFLSEALGAPVKGQVIAEFEDKTPAIIEYTDGKKPHIVCNFSAYYPQTVRKEFFPVLIQCAVDHLSPRESITTIFNVGNARVKLDETIKGEIKIKNLQNNTTTSVTADSNQINLKAGAPGNFEAKYNGKSLFFSVNVDGEGSDLNRVAELDGVEIHKQFAYTSGTTSGDLPIFKIILITAVILIFMELLLAR